MLVEEILGYDNENRLEEETPYLFQDDNFALLFLPTFEAGYLEDTNLSDYEDDVEPIEVTNSTDSESEENDSEIKDENDNEVIETVTQTELNEELQEPIENEVKNEDENEDLTDDEDSLSSITERSTVSELDPEYALLLAQKNMTPNAMEIAYAEYLRSTEVSSTISDISDEDDILDLDEDILPYDVELINNERQPNIIQRFFSGIYIPEILRSIFGILYKIYIDGFQILNGAGNIVESGQSSQMESFVIRRETLYIQEHIYIMLPDYYMMAFGTIFDGIANAMMNSARRKRIRRSQIMYYNALIRAGDPNVNTRCVLRYLYECGLRATGVHREANN